MNNSSADVVLEQRILSTPHPAKSSQNIQKHQIPVPHQQPSSLPTKIKNSPTYRDNKINKSYEESTFFSTIDNKKALNVN